jgi:hypothetical protein
MPPKRGPRDSALRRPAQGSLDTDRRRRARPGIESPPTPKPDCRSDPVLPISSSWPAGAGFGRGCGRGRGSGLRAAGADFGRGCGLRARASGASAGFGCERGLRVRARASGAGFGRGHREWAQAAQLPKAAPAPPTRSGTAPGAVTQGLLDTARRWRAACASRRESRRPPNPIADQLQLGTVFRRGLVSGRKLSRSPNPLRPSIRSTPRRRSR